jgi:betaine-aldehyde dehydrogenase
MNMPRARKFLVNGEWRTGKGDTFDSINPADGTVAGVVYSATPQDVDDAVRGGAAAVENPDWRDMPAHKRASLLNRFADLIDREREMLVELQTQDNGKTLKEGYQHVDGAVQKFRYCAAVCETLESTIIPPRGNYFVYKTFEPMGVPAGIVNVVTGGAEVGATLVNHPEINMIAFTGGTKTGRIIGHAAAERIIPCILELGGKSPNIVFEDANLDHAVAGVIYGIFSNAGQSCIAGSRIFVQASIYDGFVARLVEATKSLKVGSPRDPETAVAPVASFRQRDAIERLIEMGKRDPVARLLCGGERPAGGDLSKGAYVTPTLFEVNDHRCAIAQEEIFGPVGVVIKFKTEEDLVRMANDTVFGLSLGVWTENYRKAMRTVRAIKAGTVWVNTHKIGQPSVPMGGFKESGIGRENGIDGILEYLQIKNTYWNLSDSPISWPPRR